MQCLFVFVWNCCSSIQCRVKRRIGKSQQILYIIFSIFILLPAWLPSAPRDFVLEYSEFQKRAAQRQGSLSLPKDQLLSLWNSPEYVAKKVASPLPLAARDQGRNHWLFLRASNALKQIGDLKRKHKEEAELIALQMQIPKETLWWKRIDRRAALRRRLGRKERSLAQKIAGLSRQGLSALNQIDDLDLESAEQTRLLRAALLRNAISNQTALDETEAALKALKDLSRFNPIQKDWVLHYYFAYCLERRLARYRKDTARSERELRKVRKNKNFHLLYSVELRFGKNSDEFREIQRLIKHEELGNPRSSHGPEFYLF